MHANTVIGADGFGYANEKGQWGKIPQLGSVIIGDQVEIGASTTIDRGAIDDTIIERNVIIDNQVQIAHNVIVKEGTAIAGCTVIAGSTTIGKYCQIGGLSGIAGHIEIVKSLKGNNNKILEERLSKHLVEWVSKYKKDYKISIY